MDLYAEDSFLWRLDEQNVQQGADEEAQIPGASGKQEKTIIPEAARPLREGRPAAVYGLVAGPFGSAGKKGTMVHCIAEPDGFTMAEPNVLLLDRAQWKLNGGEWQAEEDILRIDNHIRALLGYPRRQDAFIQPWRVREAPEKDVVTLRIKMESRVETGSLMLALERPEKIGIRWNGIPCPIPKREETGWFTDTFIRTVSVPGLKKGENELLLEVPFGQKTNLENLFLLGEFGVCVLGTKSLVTAAPTELAFGDITRQGLPFYGGSITYSMHFEMDREKDILVKVPHFTAPVLEVWIDGKSAGLIAFAPHTLSLGRVAAGRHSLEICAYGNRFNSFGTLHNCNEEFKWYGPDSYRTVGDEWSEAWCLRPFGILSRVEIWEGDRIMEINKNLLWLETGEKGEEGMALTVRFTDRIGESAGLGLLLTGPDGYRLEQKLPLAEGEKEAIFFCPAVNLWDPEHPFLYQAAVTLECGEKILAVREENIGFRTLEKAGKELLWNHTPLKLRGICYRERKEDREGTKKDLELFAAAHINFLRSIYGPFSGYLLQLCDEMGFLAEDTAPFYEVGQEKPALQDLPHCREDFLKPVKKKMLEDSCHVSVLIWSLGHDCAWGANFRAAAEWIRMQDPLRPLTFHLPMSIPEEEEQMDIWPVHYIDWRQPLMCALTRW